MRRRPRSAPRRRPILTLLVGGLIGTVLVVANPIPAWAGGVHLNMPALCGASVVASTSRDAALPVEQGGLLTNEREDGAPNTSGGPYYGLMSIGRSGANAPTLSGKFGAKGATGPIKVDLLRPGTDGSQPSHVVWSATNTLGSTIGDSWDFSPSTSSFASDAPPGTYEMRVTPTPGQTFYVEPTAISGGSKCVLETMDCPECDEARRHAADSQAEAADPVRTSSGGLHETATDIVVPGRGLGLSASRTYWSLGSTDIGAFGYGWTSSLSSRLVKDTQNWEPPGGSPTAYVKSYTVIQASGSKVSFVKRPNGTYAAPQDVSATLTDVAGGFVDYRVSGGTTTRFEAATGRMVSKRDRVGHTTTYGAVVGGLQDVVEKDHTGATATGRKLVVHWTAGVSNPHITQIEAVLGTGVLGPKADYTYDGDELRAVVVSDPSKVADGQYRTEYTYQLLNGYHLLKTTRSPENTVDSGPSDTGDFVTNTYELKPVPRTSPQVQVPKVTEQWDASGQGTVFDYSNLLNLGMVSVRFGAVDEYQAGTHYRFDIYAKQAGPASVPPYSWRAGQLIKQWAGSGTNPYMAVPNFEYDQRTLGLSKITLVDEYQTAQPQMSRVMAAISYDDRGNKESVTSFGDPNEGLAPRVTTYGGYDAFDQPLSVMDPMGVVTSYTYNGTNGNLESVCSPVAPSGHAAPLGCATPGAVQQLTRYEYDPAHPGDRIRVIDPRGKTWTTRYAATTGYVTSEADPLGERTRFSRDALGRLTRTIAPKGYAPTGPDDGNDDNDSDNTDSNPYAIRVATNIFGDPLSVTDAMGTTTTRVLDRDGFETSVVLPPLQDGATRQTTTERDDAGKVVRVTEPNGVVQETAYWRSGLVESHTQDGQTTSYAYDGNGRLQFIAHPGSSCNVYLTPAGMCERYNYGFWGPLESVSYSGRSSCTSDLVGSEETNCVSYSWNGFGELRSYAPGGFSSNPDTGARAFNITYDKAGRRTGQTVQRGGADVSESWSWDSIGRLTDTTDELGAHTAYGWDLNSNPTAIAYPGGQCSAPVSKCVVQGYDDASRWTSVTDYFSASPRTTTFPRDLNGNLDSFTYPTTTATSDRFTYDRADYLVDSGATQAIRFQKGATMVGTISYTRFGGGQVRSADASNPNKLPGATAHNYGYDGADRLCWSTPTPSGNTCTNAPTTPGTNRYTYDASDHLTSVADGTNQVFNPLDQLCFTTPGAPSSSSCTTPPTNATTYGYDGQGSRTSKTPPQTPDAGSTQPSQYTFDHFKQMTAANLPTLVGNSGDYTSIAQGAGNRVIDTRTQAPGTIPANGTVEVQLLGTGGIPAGGVSAAAVLVTALNPAAGGTLQVYSSDLSAPPGNPSVTFGAGALSGGAVVVRPGVNGKVKIKSTSSSPVDVAIDAQGTWAAGSGQSGGTFTPVGPVRMIDTRIGQNTAQAKIPAGATLSVPLPGLTSNPNPTVDTAALNITVVNNPSAGFLGAFSSDLTAWPGNGSVAFAANQTTAGFVVSRVGADGKVKLVNYSAQPIDVIIDGLGTSSKTESRSGSVFTPLDATTVFDSRTSSPVGCQAPCGPLAAGSITNVAPMPYGGITAVAVTVTAVNPSGVGLVSLTPAGVGAIGVTSTLNYQAGSNVTNAAIVPLASGGTFAVGVAGASTDVTIQITGIYRAATSDWKYTYGSEGERLTKTGPPDSVAKTGRTEFTWSDGPGLPRLLRESSQLGGAGGRVNTYFVYGPAGLPIATIDDAGTPTYYHHDQLGSTRMTTNAAGNVLAYFDYDEYGKQTYISNVWYPAKLGYAGQYADTETGFIYMRARYYDPGTGQFTSSDPLSRATRSTYGYVGGDTLNRTDPSGRIDLCAPWNTDCWTSAGRRIINEVSGANEVGENLAGPNANCYDVGGGHTECDGAAVSLGGRPYTVGDIILNPSNTPLDSDVLEHEKNHSNQWAGFGGWGFLPAYLCDLYLVHHGDADCSWFEQAADSGKGGYTNTAHCAGPPPGPPGPPGASSVPVNPGDPTTYSG